MYAVIKRELYRQVAVPVKPFGALDAWQLERVLRASKCPELVEEFGWTTDWTAVPSNVARPTIINKWEKTILPIIASSRIRCLRIAHQGDLPAFFHTMDSSRLQSLALDFRDTAESPPKPGGLVQSLLLQLLPQLKVLDLKQDAVVALKDVKEAFNSDLQLRNLSLWYSAGQTAPRQRGQPIVVTLADEIADACSVLFRSCRSTLNHLDIRYTHLSHDFKTYTKPFPDLQDISQLTSLAFRLSANSGAWKDQMACLDELVGLKSLIIAGPTVPGIPRSDVNALLLSIINILKHRRHPPALEIIDCSDLVDGFRLRTAPKSTQQSWHERMDDYAQEAEEISDVKLVLL